MYTHYDLFKHVLYVQFSNYCDQVILEDQSFLALNGIDYKIYIHTYIPASETRQIAILSK